MTQGLYLNVRHPLATVAAEHCDNHAGALVGGVACGRCWEQAIRDDERVVVEFSLPREQTPDPLYVDSVAVERACAGHRVSLTAAEIATAIHILLNRGLAVRAIAERLSIAERDVMRGRAGKPPLRGGVAA